jgi:hypothetical protein
MRFYIADNDIEPMAFYTGKAWSYEFEAALLFETIPAARVVREQAQRRFPNMHAEIRDRFVDDVETF